MCLFEQEKERQNRSLLSVELKPHEVEFFMPREPASLFWGPST